MELHDTIKLMESEDFRDRFKAEYYQLKIRYEKLDKMIGKYYTHRLDFELTCDIGIYEFQLSCMKRYMDTLEFRAEKEGIEL